MQKKLCVIILEIINVAASVEQLMKLPLPHISDGQTSGIWLQSNKPDIAIGSESSI